VVPGMVLEICRTLREQYRQFPGTLHDRYQHAGRGERFSQAFAQRGRPTPAARGRRNVQRVGRQPRIGETLAQPICCYRVPFPDVTNV